MHVSVSRRLRDFDTKNAHIQDTVKIEDDLIRKTDYSRKQQKLLDARIFYAASRITGIARGFLARLIYHELLREKKAAIKIQRIIRGWLGRLRWKHEYWKSVSVVKSKAALQEMLKRSRAVREEIKKRGYGSAGYHWRELFDPLSNSFWYYNSKTGENTWNCPLPLQLTLVCSWEGYHESGGLPSKGKCRCVFETVQAYQNHLATEHVWYCDACEHRNSGGSFPICSLCENHYGGGDGRAIFNMSEVLKANVSGMRRTLKGFLHRDDAQRKDFIRGYKIKDRIVELAEDNRDQELQHAHDSGDPDEWDLLLRLRFDEDNRPRESQAESLFSLPGSSNGFSSAAINMKHTGAALNLSYSAKLEDLDPLESLLTVPLTDIRQGIIPAMAVDAIIRGVEVPEIRHARDEGGFVEKDYEKVVLPPGGVFICSAFSKGLCTSTTCPLAHPGLRDAACIEYYKPDVPGLRKRPYVTMCSEYICGTCASDHMKCTKYHIYIRPDTADIIRRIYPIQVGNRTKVFAAGDVEFKGKVSCTGFHGYGVMTWKAKAMYVGNWEENRRHGFGIFRTAEGYEYIGHWKHGVREGLGYFTHPNSNESYEGEFKDGRISGIGEFRMRDGSVYIGNFANDKFEGIGVYKKSNGDRLIGNFSGGLLEGFGAYSLRSGETYKGFFVKGERQGRGVCTYVNGSKYYGTWYCGLPQGHGVFLAPTSARIRYRDTCIKEGLHGKYVGQFESGFLHGTGTYLFPDNSVYTGSWSRNAAHGRGVLHCSSGSVYSGEWVHNKRQGLGTYTFANGSVYNGCFAENNINGKGIFKYAAGASYRGQFKDNRKHGKGIYTWSNGNIYKGEFDSGSLSGYGSMVYSSGCSYKGQWKRNKKHGRGEMVYMNGDVYDGEFKEDLRCGHGKMTFVPNTPLEESYDGAWSDDSMHGFGIYRYRASDGLVYEGDFKRGRREGKGKLTFKDGSYYEGDIYNEQMDGLGTYVGTNGIQYEGEWSSNLRHGDGRQVYPDKTIYSGQFYMNMRQGLGTTYFQDGQSSHYGEWAEDLMVGGAVGTHTLFCGPGARGGPSEIKVKVFGF